MIGLRKPRRTVRRPPPIPQPVDLLSQLPDDLLSHILSSLSVEEAVRAKLLSKRWRNLYPANPTLQFRLREFESAARVSDFVGQVSRAMQQFRVPKIKAFDLEFIDLVETHELALDKSAHARNVDEWISRAFAMNVERISLNFYPGQGNGGYIIPLHLLSGVGLCHLTILNPKYCSLPPFTSLAGPLISLRKLYLCRVSIDNFEVMPSYCPNLETLIFHWCEQLPSMQHVLGRFKCLKSLDVCSDELDLAIHGANIKKFIFLGSVKSISLKGLNCLQSAHIAIGSKYSSSKDVAIILSSLLEGAPRLERLSMHLFGGTVFLTPSSKATFKCLTSFILDMICDTDVLNVAEFLPFAPLLQKLSISVRGAIVKWSAVWLEEQMMPKRQEQHLHAKHNLHSHLKEIEFSRYGRYGFSFGKIEVELIVNLLQSAASLEKAIFNYSSRTCNGELRSVLQQYKPEIKFVEKCGVNWVPPKDSNRIPTS